MSVIVARTPGEIATLEGLAEAINREHEACEASYQASLDHALRCGQYLLEAKKQVTHGQWGKWLASETQVSDRTSQVYMQVARDLPQLEALAAKPQSIQQALMLLRPKQEESPLVEVELVVESMPVNTKPGPVEVGSAATVISPEHPLHGKQVDVVDQRGQCYVARYHGHEYPLLPYELAPVEEARPSDRPKNLTLREAIALIERSYQEASRYFSVELRHDIEAALNL